MPISDDDNKMTANLWNINTRENGASSSCSNKPTSLWFPPKPPSLNLVASSFFYGPNKPIITASSINNDKNEKTIKESDRGIFNKYKFLFQRPTSKESTVQPLACSKKQTSLWFGDKIPSLNLVSSDFLIRGNYEKTLKDFSIKKDKTISETYSEHINKLIKRYRRYSNDDKIEEPVCNQKQTSLWFGNKLPSLNLVSSEFLIRGNYDKKNPCPIKKKDKTPVESTNARHKRLRKIFRGGSSSEAKLIEQPAICNKKQSSSLWVGNKLPSLNLISSNFLIRGNNDGKIMNDIKSTSFNPHYDSSESSCWFGTKRSRDKALCNQINNLKLDKPNEPIANLFGTEKISNIEDSDDESDEIVDDIKNILDSPNIKPSWDNCILSHGVDKDPVVPVKYNDIILGNTYNDDIIDSYVWIVNMSEIFYYENTLQIFVKNRYFPNNFPNALMSNFIHNIQGANIDNWKNIVKLGEGSFGQVFRVQDKETDEYMVVKYIKKLGKHPSRYHAVNTLLLYLQERHYVMRAYESRYFTQFKYSFQVKEVNGLFLAFEYCICDLGLLLHIFKLLIDIDPSEMLLNPHYKFTTFEQYHAEMTNNINFNIESLVAIYIFELFSILYHLSIMNIVHCDIKPDNIMIYTDGHLKLGDFGLVNNTRFVYRNIYRYMIRDKDVIKVRDEDYENVYAAGTLLYLEMEACYLRLDDVQRDNIKYSKDFIIERGYHLPDLDSYVMDYLSDIWSMGMTIAELLFMGHHFLDYRQINVRNYIVLDLIRDSAYNTCKIMYLNDYKRYVMKGFERLGGKKYKDICELLISIFKPRSNRARNYTERGSVHKWNKTLYTRKISIDIIEEMDYFKSKNINWNSVNRIEIPQVLIENINYFKDLHSKSPMTVKEWINDLKLISSDKNLFMFEPGCTINIDI